MLRVQEINEGMRVRGEYNAETFMATVYKLHDGRATLKRDDGIKGSGVIIKESPYDGDKGWVIDKTKEGWSASGSDGKLYYFSWKDIMEQED